MAKQVAIFLQKLRKKNSGKECNEVSDQKGMQCKKLPFRSVLCTTMLCTNVNTSAQEVDSFLLVAIHNDQKVYVESICCDASKLQYKSVSWKVLGEVDAEKGKRCRKG